MTGEGRGVGRPPTPGARVSVEVPATTANLGAGFDALALALELINRVRVEVRAGGAIELLVRGEGDATLDAGEDNRFLVGLRAGLHAALGHVPQELGWRVEMDNAIPLGRGLGSSAAATVAGLVAADTLTGAGLAELELLALAAAIEGHPDNAAAALLGGFVVAALDGSGSPLAVRLEPPPGLLAVLFIPERPLSTAMMRGALPETVPRRDAVHNVGRAALCVAAFATGRVELLRPATQDRLHEPYRAAVYPELPLLLAAARDAGAVGACLSGAGSTILAFAGSEGQARALQAALEAAAGAAALPGRVLIAAMHAGGAAATVETAS